MTSRSTCWRHNEHAQARAAARDVGEAPRETEKLKLSLRQLTPVEEAKRKKNIRSRARSAPRHTSDPGDHVVDPATEPGSRRSSAMTEQIEHDERKLICGSGVNEDLSAIRSSSSSRAGSEADADQQLIELNANGAAPAASPGVEAAGKGAADAELVEDERAPPGGPAEHESVDRSRLSGATFVAHFVAALAIWFVIRWSKSCSSFHRRAVRGVPLGHHRRAGRRFRRRLAGAYRRVSRRSPRWWGSAPSGGPGHRPTQALISGWPQTLTNIQNEIAAGRVSIRVRSTELANPHPGGGKPDRRCRDFLRRVDPPVRNRRPALFVEGASVVVMPCISRASAPVSRRYPCLVSPSIASRARILDDLGANVAGRVVGQLLAMMVLAFLTRSDCGSSGALLAGLRHLSGLGPWSRSRTGVDAPPRAVRRRHGDWLRVLAVIWLGVVVHVSRPTSWSAHYAAPDLAAPVLTIASVLTMGT